MSFTYGIWLKKRSKFYHIYWKVLYNSLLLMVNIDSWWLLVVNFSYHCNYYNVIFYDYIHLHWNIFIKIVTRKKKGVFLEFITNRYKIYNFLIMHIQRWHIQHHNKIYTKTFINLSKLYFIFLNTNMQ